MLEFLRFFLETWSNAPTSERAINQPTTCIGWVLTVRGGRSTHTLSHPHPHTPSLIHTLTSLLHTPSLIHPHTHLSYRTPTFTEAHTHQECVEERSLSRRIRQIFTNVLQPDCLQFKSVIVQKACPTSIDLLIIIGRHCLMWSLLPRSYLITISKWLHLPYSLLYWTGTAKTALNW